VIPKVEVSSGIEHMNVKFRFNVIITISRIKNEVAINEVDGIVFIHM